MFKRDTYGQYIPYSRGQQPKLMRELLVEMLAEESWIEIVGEVAQEAEIRESVQKTAPDLLVVTADKPASARICDELLREYPRYTSSRSHRTKITPSVIGRPRYSCRRYRIVGTGFP